MGLSGRDMGVGLSGRIGWVSVVRMRWSRPVATGGGRGGGSAPPGKI